MGANKRYRTQHEWRVFEKLAGTTLARLGPKVVRINAIHHALANSGHAGQAVLTKRVPRFNDAGGWRSNRNSIAIYLHTWLIERGVETADTALRIVWRRIHSYPCFKFRVSLEESFQSSCANKW